MYVRIISALEMLACRHEPILAMHVGGDEWDFKLCDTEIV